MVTISTSIPIKIHSKVRECGGCMVCCNVTQVPELQKPARTLCENCVSNGCGIYDSRPQSCRKFECAWLQGEMGEEMRPDKTHVMIEKVSETIRLALEEPGYSNSCQGPIKQELMNYANNGIAIAVVSDSENQLLLPRDADPEIVVRELEALMSKGMRV